MNNDTLVCGRAIQDLAETDQPRDGTVAFGLAILSEPSSQRVVLEPGDQTVGSAQSALRVPADPFPAGPPGLAGQLQAGASTLERPGAARALQAEKSRKLGPKPGTKTNSCVQQTALCKNDVWTYDLIHDRTAAGRPFNWLTLVDEYSRKCLVLHASGSLTGAEVRRILAHVIGHRGAPTRIRNDNGSEFICDVLAHWLPRGGEVNTGGHGKPPGELIYTTVHDLIARQAAREGGIRGRTGEGA